MKFSKKVFLPVLAFLFVCIGIGMAQRTKGVSAPKAKEEETVFQEMEGLSEIKKPVRPGVTDFDMEKEVIGKGQETGSLRIAKYMDKLSRLQKSVLKLVIDGYLPEEIREKLKINKAQYADCYEAIHSYRNVCVLF